MHEVRCELDVIDILVKYLDAISIQSSKVSCTHIVNASPETASTGRMA